MAKNKSASVNGYSTYDNYDKVLTSHPFVKNINARVRIL